MIKKFCYSFFVGKYWFRILLVILLFSTQDCKGDGNLLEIHLLWFKILDYFSKEIDSCFDLHQSLIWLARSHGEQGICLASRAVCLVIRFVLLDNTSGMPFDLFRGNPAFLLGSILFHLVKRSNLNFWSTNDNCKGWPVWGCTFPFSVKWLSVIAYYANLMSYH